MEDWTNYYMYVVLSLPRLYLFLWVYLDVYIIYLVVLFLY